MWTVRNYSIILTNRLRYQHIALRQIVTLLFHSFPPILLTDQDISYLLLFIQICWKLQDEDGLQFILQTIGLYQLDFSEYPEIQTLITFLKTRFSSSVFFSSPSLPLPPSLTVETLSNVFTSPVVDASNFSLDLPVEVIHLSSHSCWNLVVEKLVECVRNNTLGTRFHFVFPDSFTNSMSPPPGSQNSLDSDPAVVIPLQPSDEQSISSQKEVLPLTPWHFNNQQVSSSSVLLTESTVE